MNPRDLGTWQYRNIIFTACSTKLAGKCFADNFLCVWFRPSRCPLMHKPSLPLQHSRTEALVCTVQKHNYSWSILWWTRVYTNQETGVSVCYPGSRRHDSVTSIWTLTVKAFPWNSCISSSDTQMDSPFHRFSLSLVGPAVNSC